MVSLTLLAVLIVGTSVGVAVSASHLRENEVLDAGDIWLAMASQGLLAWPVPGDYSDLAVGDVEPVMYKAGGIYLAVYEFADAQQRYALNYSYVWRESISCSLVSLIFGVIWVLFTQCRLTLRSREWFKPRRLFSS